jgi:hypothetical protein
MADSKHMAVWEWLMTCPHIKDLFFVFSQTDDDDISLEPSESVVETYIDGGTLRNYDVALACSKSCSFEPNELENITNLVDFEQLGEWVEAQNASRNFPAFPPGECVQEIRVLPNESGFVTAQDETGGKFMLQFQIEYLKG